MIEEESDTPERRIAARWDSGVIDEMGYLVYAQMEGNQTGILCTCELLLVAVLYRSYHGLDV